MGLIPAGKVRNLVSCENECGAKQNRGQKKIADTFTITMECRKFGSDAIQK